MAESKKRQKQKQIPGLHEELRVGSRENEITVQAYTLSVFTPPIVHSAFLPVLAMSHGTQQEAKRR